MVKAEEMMFADGCRTAEGTGAASGDVAEHGNLQKSSITFNSLRH
jgi:hypothetical protein